MEKQMKAPAPTKPPSARAELALKARLGRVNAHLKQGMNLSHEIHAS